MRFKFDARALCLDFANTIHDSHAEDKGDELRSISDVLQWAKEAALLSTAEYDRLVAGYEHSARDAAAALTRSIEIRDLLLSVFAAIADGRSPGFSRLAELNSALADIPAVLSVHKRGSRFSTFWATAAGGLQRVHFAVLSSAAELLESDRFERIRECASDNCTWLFVDKSRNGSRRWCDMSTCGNRVKARRHYRRTRARRHRPAS